MVVLVVTLVFFLLRVTGTTGCWLGLALRAWMWCSLRCLVPSTQAVVGLTLMDSTRV